MKIAQSPGFSRGEFVNNSKGRLATISGGAGDDSIYLRATSGLVQYASGDGNDTILGFNESDTLTITGDSYSTQESGNDIIVQVGEGSIRLVGAKGKNLNINKTGSTKIISLTEDDDELANYLGNVTIYGFAGDDSIDNGADSITIDAGAGDDDIWNSGDNVSIDGGADDDTIHNRYGVNVSINSGAGNDQIFLGSRNIIEYTSGDGFDRIYGFRSDSTLKIGGGTGTYSSQTSGSDIVVTVGEEQIILIGAATLASVKILGEYKNPPLITLTENDDTYSNTLEGATILALGGNDTILNSLGANVSIDAGDGKDIIENGGSNSTINGGDGSDMIENRGSNASIDGGTGNDTFSTMARMSQSTAAKAPIQFSTTPVLTFQSMQARITIQLSTVAIRLQSMVARATILLSRSTTALSCSRARRV